MNRFLNLGLQLKIQKNSRIASALLLDLLPLLLIGAVNLRIVFGFSYYSPEDRSEFNQRTARWSRPAAAALDFYR
jgi:hypothetical protein